MAAITASVIGAGTAIYSANRASKQQKQAKKDAQSLMDSADPYKEYREDAAKRLNALVADPSSIKDTASYKARMQAAERTLAAQGYTGSGNAIIEAANAGGAAYQQEFDMLARLAGVDTGLQSAAGIGSTSLGVNQNASDNYLSAIAGVGNNIGNLAGLIFNRPVASTGGASTPRVGTGPA